MAQTTRQMASNQQRTAKRRPTFTASKVLKDALN